MAEEIADLYVSLRAETGGWMASLRHAVGGARDFESGLKMATASAAGFLGRDLVHAAGRAVTAVAELGMGFEDSMNMLQAVSGASATEMGRVGKAAKDLGADMSLPATSAADAGEAMVELSKAGLSVNATLGAARGVLQLSAAGAISNAEAATIAAGALNVFGLSGREASRVADLLAAAANASSAEVTDVAAAMQQSAAVAAQAGVPIEDLTTSIALMANAGIAGSDAGTSLKTMLMRLQAPTEAARSAMDAMGISVFDAGGTMLPTRDIIGQFSGALSTMSQEQRAVALQTIFGSDAIRAANVVLGAGVEAWDLTKGKVTEYGAGAELAEARTKGLRGAIEGLKSQLETAALAGYEAAAPALRALVTEAAALVPVVMELAGGLGHELAPAARAVAELVASVARAVVPFAQGLATLGLGAVVGGLKAMADVLEPLAGFLADNDLAVRALAVGLALLAAVKVVNYMKDFGETLVLGAVYAKDFAVATAQAAVAAGPAGLLGSLGKLAGMVGPGAVLASLAYAFQQSGESIRQTNREAKEFAASIAEAGHKTEDIGRLREEIGKVEGVLDDQTAAFRRLGDGSIHQLAEVGTKVADLRREVTSLKTESYNLETNLSNAKGMLGLTGEEARKLATDLGVNLKGNVVDTTTAMAEGFRAQHKEAVDSYVGVVGAANLGKAGIAAASKLSIDDIKALAEAATALAKAMTDSFSSATSVVQKLGSQATVTKGEVLAFFREQVAAARDWAANMAALAKSGIDDGLLKELAQAGPKAAPLVKALLDAVQSGNVESINSAQTALRQIMTDTVGVVQGAVGPAGAAGVAVGSAIGQGVNKGLDGPLSAAKLKAEGYATSIIAAMRKAGEIRSPSAVTEEQVGVPLAEGVIVGLESMLGPAFTAGAAVTASVTSGMVGGIIPGLAGMVAAMSDGVGATGALIAVLDAIPREITVAVNIVTSGGLPDLSGISAAAAVPAFAGGVQNFGGGWALVGEHGPELLDLGRGSDVYTAQQTASVLGGSHVTVEAGAVQINITGTADEAAVRRGTTAAMEQMIATLVAVL